MKRWSSIYRNKREIHRRHFLIVSDGYQQRERGARRLVIKTTICGFYPGDTLCTAYIRARNASKGIWTVVAVTRNKFRLTYTNVVARVSGGERDKRACLCVCPSVFWEAGENVGQGNDVATVRAPQPTFPSGAVSARSIPLRAAIAPTTATTTIAATTVSTVLSYVVRLSYVIRRRVY